jgi:hypothetical protein
MLNNRNCPQTIQGSELIAESDKLFSDAISSPGRCFFGRTFMTMRATSLSRARALLAVLVVVGSNSLAQAADNPPTSVGDEPGTAGKEFFEKRIRPILSDRCYPCHSQLAQKVKGKLLLDSRAGLLKGGSSGPAIVPGDPAKSLIIKAVRYEDDTLQMPPKTKLSALEISDLETWVKMGAPDPRIKASSTTKVMDIGQARNSWVFRPVQGPPVPSVKNEAWPLNAVDRFVLHKLEARGLTPLEPADKRTLIRRATFDLTGLPPTPKEIDAFLEDDSAQAFARVVDRLLDTPAYGERWGRHWLDVVRYSDTAGDNSDYPVPQMFKYRNWVINAIGHDKPYDEFLREQLAGDLMPSAGAQDRYNKIIATGYLASARRFGSEADPRYPWHLTIEDTIDNLGRALQGLTINCARCHDHKFDPISNEDYYALYGFFQSTRYPWPGIELDKAPRDLVPLAPENVVREGLKDRLPKLAAFDAELKQIAKDKEAADKALLETQKARGDSKRVAEITKRIESLVDKNRSVQNNRDKYAKVPLPFETAYAVIDAKDEDKKKVGNACIQIKGDPEHLGKEVERHFPEVLGGMRLPPDVKGSGRLELAAWISSAVNPMTARVMVNRIWHYHFGKGIVQTPNDFGKQGRPPTHPELLDYLASRLVDSGWSIKAMHRLVMLSRTYQLSSRDEAANSRLDLNNDYLWRFNRSRLDAESIRDTILAVSGDLDRSQAGPHPFPDQTKWDYTEHNVFKQVYENHRRSVYLMTQRLYRHPFLGLFDGAGTNASTDRRVVSTTSLQALYLMNDPFVHAQARKFASRLFAEQPDESRRIGWAYLLMMGRPVTEEEKTAAEEYLAKVRAKIRASNIPADQQTAHAWESFARALFLSSEFVYVN